MIGVVCFLAGTGRGTSLFGTELIDEKEGFVPLVFNQQGIFSTTSLHNNRDGIEGFTRLWEKKRLDLSVEAIVLKSQFAPLFDEIEQANARKRLADYGYKVPWDNPKK